VPELRLPDICNARVVLHTADRHDHGVLQDLPGRPQDRAGGTAGAEPPGEQPLLPRDQRQKWRWPGRVENRRQCTGTRPTWSPGQQQCQHRHHGNCLHINPSLLLFLLLLLLLLLHCI